MPLGLSLLALGCKTVAQPLGTGCFYSLQKIREPSPPSQPITKSFLYLQYCNRSMSSRLWHRRPKRCAAARRCTMPSSRTESSLDFSVIGTLSSQHIGHICRIGHVYGISHVASSSSAHAANHKLHNTVTLPDLDNTSRVRLTKVSL